MPPGRVGASSAAGRGCCDHGATPGERLQCERSCALVAILTARPAAFAVGPLAAVAAAPAPRVAPLFAAAIEHIPL